MEKQKKIYCGSGKKKSDTWFQITINPEKIKDYVQEYNGSKFIKLNVNLKGDIDKYGKDIDVSIDTWKPDGAKASAPLDTKNDDLPF